MVAAMTRHLHSLRRLKRDHGWIHTLLGTDHAIGYINVIYAGRIVLIHMQYNARQTLEKRVFKQIHVCFI